MNACPECGAPLDGVSACRALLDELLALEWRVEGGSGTLSHFFAVSSYNLQHPSGFTPDALRSLRAALADVLEERATIHDILRRNRALLNGEARVRRRADTPIGAEDRAMLDAWPTHWRMTVADVCRVAPEAYHERARAWAAAVSASLPPPPPVRQSR